ncbi:Fc.00g078570.m01.CDS01 [Cosmosporella sp. VM-42]
MSDNPTQPKGILKKRAKKEPAVDAKELAIQHAKILQYQKNLEAEILDSLVLLSEYPVVTSPPYNSANPAPSDVADFKKHVRLFQPGDYDDLIIERNVNGLCGYSLCANPKKDMGPGGEWKITSSGIVNRKELEKWCSQQCARRALYVKVQLNETAAWERAGIPDIEIELLDEDKSTETDTDRTARKLAELNLNDQRQAARDSEALALERGQRGASGDKVQFTLKEKDVKPPSAEAETSENYDDDHLIVEGYKSKSKLKTGSQDPEVGKQ